MFTCNPCNRTFSNKYNLQRHQTSSLYCKIERENSINIQTNQIECSFCNKNFSYKSSLVRHEKVCKVKKQQEIDSLKKQLEEARINNSSSIDNSHNTNTNNSYNKTYNYNVNNQEFKNLRVLDMSIVKECVLQRITEDVIKSGLNNTANQIANGISPFVITSDLGRQIVVSKDKHSKPNKKDAPVLASGVINECSDSIIRTCNRAMEKEMEKPDKELYEKSNIRARNNICTVRANINDNKKGNINELSRKTGQYLSKKSYNRDNGETDNETIPITQDIIQEERVPSRPIETDMLYDSDSE